MSEEDNKKEEHAHSDAYYSQLGLDVKKLLNKKVSKTAAEAPFEIPEVEEDKPAQEPGIGNLTKDNEKLKKELEELKAVVEKLSLEERFRQVKEDVMIEVEDLVKSLKQELEDIKDRKIPQAGEFDTGGMHKERLYEVATRVLDRVLLSLFDDIPDYSLLKTQVSRTFDDGTVSDALVSVNVTVPNDGYRYDFTIEVPVLNGIMQYPTYMQRGQKIIPLSREKIQEEINSMAFRKIEVEDPYSKDNIFNNIGDNIHKKPDNQKFYETKNYEPNSVGVPPASRYPAHRTRGEN